MLVAVGFFVVSKEGGEGSSLRRGVIKIGTALEQMEQDRENTEKVYAYLKNYF